MITAIDHIEVITDDMEKSIDFYRNTLGFKIVRRFQYLSARPGGLGEICYLMLGEVAVELLGYKAAAPGEEAPPLPPNGVKMIAFRVDNMAKTLDEMKQRGTEASRPPNKGSGFDGLRAEIMDGQGVSFELREWQDGDGPGDNPNWQPKRADIARIS